MRKLVLSYCAVLLLCACNPIVVYKQSVDINNETWSYNDKINYSFSIQDTSCVYSLWLEIDHGITYAYQNVYVKILTSFPDGSDKSDIVSLELANKNGLWNGKCRGSKCKVIIPLQEKTYFQEQGDYAISLEQYMRVDNLQDLKAFTLRLQKEDS